MMKAFALTFALVLICSGAALAQTPDGQTPAEETVCDSENGAAFGLCNAYCEAMDCDSGDPQASATACTKVRDKFMNIAGHDLPCEAPAGCPAPPPGTICPCVAGISGFADVLADPNAFCDDQGTTILKLTNVNAILAQCTSSPACASVVGGALNVTPDEASACVQLIRDSCLTE